jgi:branched-subunit amino acid ABC-type transport system permease component
MYGKPHLDQVLFSIGLTFMAVAAVDYVMGSSQVNVQTPQWLRGRFEFGSGALSLGMGAYRLFIIAVCLALTLGLQALLNRTRFGSRLRAAVDDPRVAAGLGIPVNRIFLLTFAAGSGLAGLGGALGVDIGAHTTFFAKAVGQRIFHPEGGEIQTLQGTVLRRNFHAKTLLGREPHLPSHSAGRVVDVIFAGIGLVRQLDQHPHA